MDHTLGFFLFNVIDNLIILLFNMCMDTPALPELRPKTIWVTTEYEDPTIFLLEAFERFEDDPVMLARIQEIALYTEFHGLENLSIQVRTPENSDDLYATEISLLSKGLVVEKLAPQIDT